MTNEVTENILNYILGGKARFCIYQEPRGNNKGGKIWYSVTSDNGNTFFVKELVNHTKKYLGYFFITDLATIKDLRISKKSPEVEDANKESRPLTAVLHHLYRTEELPGNGIVHIISDGKCSVCGRKLTDFESMNMGIGPTCRKRILGGK